MDSWKIHNRTPVGEVRVSRANLDSSSPPPEGGAHRRATGVESRADT